MKPTLHELSLPGAMLARGFWLYVWTVTTDSGVEWLYVGRTGDSSSPHAQSPFARLSQHLGQNPKSNALRRNLANVQVDADSCRSFDLTAYGPIFPEQKSMPDHVPIRDTVAGFEMALRDALDAAGYRLLNKVQSRKTVAPALRSQVLQAFAKKFPRLKALSAPSDTPRSRAGRGMP